jgi:hypothetical protein
LVDEEVRMMRTNPSIIDFQVISTTTGQWTKLSTYATAASSGSASVRFMASGTAPTFYIDNVSVKEVTSYSGGGFEREAYKLVESYDAIPSVHFAQTAVIGGITSGASVTTSIYVKADGRSNILLFEGFSSSGVYYDIQNGTIGYVLGTPTDYSITALANGWYRCTLTANIATTNAQFNIYLASATTNGANTYTGDGTSGIYIAYAQLEVSSYASSLMLPTTEGSTTSRVADEITNAGNQSLFSGVNNSGVLYAEIAALDNNTGFRVIGLSDGTTNNEVRFSYRSGTDIGYRLTAGSSLQVNGNYVISDQTDNHKIAIRWAVNDFSLWVDGVEVATDVSVAIFGANVLTTLNFSDFTGNAAMEGKTKALAVFDYLSDDEMETLTT